MSDVDPVERLTALFHEHSPRVLAYLLHRGAGDAAPDLLSEAFATAWRRLPDVPDPALPWLLGVARHVLAHHWRGTARRADLLEAVGQHSARSGDHGADVAEGVVERADVLRALAALSEEDREVLLLVGWDGLSTGEAAAAIGCAPGAFSVRLHRARRRLGRLLDPPESTAGVHLARTPPAHRSPVRLATSQES